MSDYPDLPVHLADQLQAAAADNWHRHDGMEDRGATVREVMPEELPPACQALFDAFSVAAVNARARYEEAIPADQRNGGTANWQICKHLRWPQSADWWSVLPDALMCETCSDDMPLDRCALCGRLDEHRTHIAYARNEHSQTTMHAVFCDECFPDGTGAPTQATS